MDYLFCKPVFLISKKRVFVLWYRFLKDSSFVFFKIKEINTAFCVSIFWNLQEKSIVWFRIFEFFMGSFFHLIQYHWFPLTIKSLSAKFRITRCGIKFQQFYSKLYQRGSEYANCFSCRWGRGKTLSLQKKVVLDITLNCIGWGGSSSWNLRCTEPPLHYH